MRLLLAQVVHRQAALEVAVCLLQLEEYQPVEGWYHTQQVVILMVVGSRRWWLHWHKGGLRMHQQMVVCRVKCQEVLVVKSHLAHHHQQYCQHQYQHQAWAPPGAPL